jgi:hypothetical protein
VIDAVLAVLYESIALDASIVAHKECLQALSTYVLALAVEAAIEIGTAMIASGILQIILIADTLKTRILSTYRTILIGK